MSVWLEIIQERDRQDRFWGGSEHDDTHSQYDWIAYIAKIVGQAVGGEGGNYIASTEWFRAQMVKVAALAVAAIQWCDRRSQDES